MIYHLSYRVYGEKEGSMTFCEMNKPSGCYECPNCYVCKKGINTVRKHFLLAAEHLTGTSREDIKVICFEAGAAGRFSGTIEINGNREFIHEYHC